MSITMGQFVLISAGLLMSWMVGIGLYQNCVVIPSWFRDPPASFSRINQYGKSELRFWIPMQALTVLALIAALFAHWNESTRRLLLLGALTCYFLTVAVTSAYFAPRIIAWGRMNPEAAVPKELRVTGNRWRALSWMRQSVLIVADLLLLSALAT